MSKKKIQRGYRNPDVWKPYPSSPPINEKKKTPRWMKTLAVLFVIVVIGVVGVSQLSPKNLVPNTNKPDTILLPSDITADPAAYEGKTVKVEGVVIQSNTSKASFGIMPINTYLGCNRNPSCGEEYTILLTQCDSCQQGCPIPPFEHDVIVTGLVKKTTDGKNYIFQGLNLIDKGAL